MIDRDRRKRLVLLLGSLHDLLPAPKGALRTASGLTPAAKRPCPDCIQEPGWRVDIFKRRTACTTCGGSPEPSGSGRTWLKKDAGRGWVKVDLMDADRAPIATDQAERGTTATRPPAVVRCDSCDGAGAHGNGQRCQHCEGTGHRTITPFVLAFDPETAGGDTALEYALEERASKGSYRELDAALDQLRAAHHRSFMALYAVHVTRTAPEPTPGSFYGTLVEMALAYLDRRMPDPIRVPAAIRAAEKHRQAHLATVRGRGGNGAGALPEFIARRDKEIRKLARQGRPTQWIASEYGLSVRQTNRVINSEREAA